MPKATELLVIENCTANEWKKNSIRRGEKNIQRKKNSKDAMQKKTETANGKFSVHINLLNVP